MHELSLAQGITDLVAECARREGITRVTRVLLDIGVAAAVEPGAIQFCFPLTAEGTVAEGAELVINRPPLKVRCEACGHEYEAKFVATSCPACHAHQPKVLPGLEVRVVSFDGA